MDKELKFQFWDKPTGKSALVCGIAFAVASMIYAAIPALSHFLFAFYMGYFLTVATGQNPRNFKKYVVCFICGYLWAIPYWYGTDWVMSLGVKNYVLARGITELILNTVLVYVHVHLLKKTWASLPPCIFAGICTIFASGSIENTPICALSIFLGMSFSLLAGIISTKWIAADKKAAANTSGAEK